MFYFFHFSEYLAGDSNEKFWKFVDLSQTVSFSRDSGIYVKQAMIIKGCKHTFGYRMVPRKMWVSENFGSILKSYK